MAPWRHDGAACADRVEGNPEWRQRVGCCVRTSRPAVADTPLYDPDSADADDWLALVTDGPRPPARCPVLRFQDTMWLQFLANLAWDGAKVVPA